MTVDELIKELQSYTDEQRELEVVFVPDGYEPLNNFQGFASGERAFYCYGEKRI